MFTQAKGSSEQTFFAKPKKDKNSLHARINTMIDSIKQTGKFVVGANELQTLTSCQEYVYDIWCSNTSKYMTLPYGEGATFFFVDLIFYTVFPPLGALFIPLATNRMSGEANRCSPFLSHELKDEEHILVRKAILNLIDLFQIKPFRNEMISVDDVHYALGKLVSFFPPKLADTHSRTPRWTR